MSNWIVTLLNTGMLAMVDMINRYAGVSVLIVIKVGQHLILTDGFQTKPFAAASPPRSQQLLTAMESAQRTQELDSAVPTATNAAGAGPQMTILSGNPII